MLHDTATDGILLYHGSPVYFEYFVHFVYFLVQIQVHCFSKDGRTHFVFRADILKTCLLVSTVTSGSGRPWPNDQTISTYCHSIECKNVLEYEIITLHLFSSDSTDRNKSPSITTHYLRDRPVRPVWTLRLYLLHSPFALSTETIGSPNSWSRWTHQSR